MFSYCPLAFSAAARHDPLGSGVAVARVNVFNYVGFVLGAPLIGLVADASSMRGAFATITLGKAEGRPLEVPVMPTFHPAYLLRNYTVETRTQVWEDLKKVLGVLGRSVPPRREATAARPAPQESEQSG